MMTHRVNHRHNGALRLAFRAGAILLLLWRRPVCPANHLTAAESRYSIPRHIEYRFTIQNTTSHSIEQAQLWLYAPVALTAAQQRVQLEATLPFQETSDELGNSILAFSLHNLRPYATKILTIRADLLLSEIPIPLPEKEESTPNPQSAIRNPQSAIRNPKLDPYLTPEPYCESDDPAIVQLANHLKAEHTTETAEHILRWVAENLDYTGYRKQPFGARHALENKQGDCTEFMYLFVALCRAAGIPARGLGGYVVEKNAILRPGDYHNWAEFYADGRWHLADPQRNLFMDNQSHYLVMRVIGAVPEDHPMQSSRRFRYDGEGLHMKMNY